MVQVIPQKIGLGEQVGQAVGAGLQQGISSGAQQGIKTLQDQLMRHKENTALKELSQKWKPDTPDTEIMQDIMTAPVSQESKKLYLSGMGQLMKLKQQEKKRGLLENILGGGQQGSVTEEVTDTVTEGVPQGSSQAFQKQAPTQAIQQQNGYSDQQIAAATLVDPNVGRMMQSKNDAIQKKMETRARLHAPAVNKYFENINERADALPQKESALISMERAISEGDLSAFSLDNIADITGIEALRTAKGADFISSGKEFFLGSLKRAGARPNQWIEQQIQKMLPKIGRSKEANLTVTEALKNELDIERKQIELSHEMADFFENETGSPPRNIASLVMKKMKPYVEEKQKELVTNLRAISKGKIPGERVAEEKVMTKVEKGTSLDANMATKILQQAGGDKEKARKIAKGLGYGF